MTYHVGLILYILYPQGYMYTDLATIYERAGRVQGRNGSITQVKLWMSLKYYLFLKLHLNIIFEQNSPDSNSDHAQRRYHPSHSRSHWLHHRGSNLCWQVKIKKILSRDAKTIKFKHNTFHKPIYYWMLICFKSLLQHDMHRSIISNC